MAHPDGWILKIPDRDKPHLAKLLALSDAASTALVEQFDKARPTLSAETLASQVVDPRVLLGESLPGVISVLVSLVLTAEIRHLSLSDVVNDVVDAAVASDIKVPDGDKAKAKGTLLKLTSNQTIAVTARAIGLLREHERMLSSARILTDMRPIFLGESPKPVAAVVTHTLRIEAHKEEGHVSEFFALDLKDLKALRDTVDRAIKKEESLKATLQSGGLSFVGEDSV